MVSCAGLTLMKNKNTAPVHGAVRYAVIVSSCIEFVRLGLSHPPRKRGTRITHCAPTQALGTHHALTLSACCRTAQQERGALDRQPWRHTGEIIRFTMPEGTRKYTRYLPLLSRRPGAVHLRARGRSGRTRRRQRAEPSRCLRRLRALTISLRIS